MLFLGSSNSLHQVLHLCRKFSSVSWRVIGISGTSAQWIGCDYCQGNQCFSKFRLRYGRGFRVSWGGLQLPAIAHCSVGVSLGNGVPKLHVTRCRAPPPLQDEHLNFKLHVSRSFLHQLWMRVCIQDEARSKSQHPFQVHLVQFCSNISLLSRPSKKSSKLVHKGSVLQACDWCSL